MTTCIVFTCLLCFLKTFSEVRLCNGESLTSCQSEKAFVTGSVLWWLLENSWEYMLGRKFIETPFFWLFIAAVNLKEVQDWWVGRYSPLLLDVSLNFPNLLGLFGWSGDHTTSHPCGHPASNQISLLSNSVAFLLWVPVSIRKCQGAKKTKWKKHSLEVTKVLWTLEKVWFRVWEKSSFFICMLFSSSMKMA